jgi:four helix bundle protein
MSEAHKGYRDLRVWQQAVELVPKVYELLKAFPKHETYGLADQIRRAAVSVPANIAEAQARHSPKEFLHGLYIARGSLAELETLLIVASRLGYIGQDSLSLLEAAITEVRMPLQGLVNNLHTRA